MKTFYQFMSESADIEEALLGGEKYKGRENPNNLSKNRSEKSLDKKVAGHAGKWSKTRDRAHNSFQKASDAGYADRDPGRHEQDAEDNVVRSNRHAQAYSAASHLRKLRGHSEKPTDTKKSSGIRPHVKDRDSYDY